MPDARVAVIGDVAGHLADLETELARLGAKDGTLPDDLTVVQVGDLIHRGPDSEGVVALVDRYLREQPERWRQLVGNHEAQYLHERAFEWPERLSDEAADTLENWWQARVMRPAVALRCGGENYLVTHAGLTAGFWQDALDRPGRAADAARALNSFAGTHDRVLFAGGQMLGGGKPDDRAGPIWATAATELVASWLGLELPFSQIHGHSSIVDRRTGVLRVDAQLAERVTVDPDVKHETVTLPGGRIIGVDPGHGRRPVRPWRSYVLDDAEVLVW